MKIRNYDEYTNRKIKCPYCNMTMVVFVNRIAYNVYSINLKCPNNDIIHITTIANKGEK